MTIAIINLILDATIVVLSLWVLQILIGYGGLIGRALTLIGSGTVIIGVAQIIETIMNQWLTSDPLAIELIHRIILVIGFIYIVWGYRVLMKK